MQRSETGFGLVDPEESRVNATLMHYAVEIVLQLQKIEGVAAKIVDVIVVHAGSFKLKAYCAEDPAGVAGDDDPLIFNVSVQAMLRWQMIRVFVEGLKKPVVELIDVSRQCVFQRQIGSLWRQSISCHAPVNSDAIESRLLKRGGDVPVGCLREVTSDYVAWKVHVTQDVPEIGHIAGKKIESEEIVFVVDQQDAPRRCGGENLWSHHFLPEIVREKASGGLSFDARHLLVHSRKCICLQLHHLDTYSRRFFLKRSPYMALSTNLTRTGI